MTFSKDMASEVGESGGVLKSGVFVFGEEIRPVATFSYVAI